jgi:hypothetical protein
MAGRLLQTLKAVLSKTCLLSLIVNFSLLRLGKILSLRQ